MKIGTMRRIAISLIAIGVISAIVGGFIVWINSGPYTGIFSADYSQCRFTQSAECQIVTKAPSWGLILIIIVLFYTRQLGPRKGELYRKS